MSFRSRPLHNDYLSARIGRPLPPKGPIRIQHDSGRFADSRRCRGRGMGATFANLRWDPARDIYHLLSEYPRVGMGKDGVPMLLGFSRGGHFRQSCAMTLFKELKRKACLTTRQTLDYVLPTNFGLRIRVAGRHFARLSSTRTRRTRSCTNVLTGFSAIRL
jgi:uncharacterized protein YjhX (UPF0386 family)